MRVMRRGSLLLLLGSLAMTDCARDPVSPPAPPTEYKGVVQGTTLGTIGTIDLLIASTPAPSRPGSSATSPVRATLRLGQWSLSTVPLEGRYDRSDRSLSLTGAGWEFHGALEGQDLVGGFSAPGRMGRFRAAEVGLGSNAIAGYLGDSFAYDFKASLVIKGDRVFGFVLDPNPPYRLIGFSGTYSDADSSLVLEDDEASAGPPLGTGRLWPNTVGESLPRVQFMLLPNAAGLWFGVPMP